MKIAIVDKEIYWIDIVKSKNLVFSRILSGNAGIVK